MFNWISNVATSIKGLFVAVAITLGIVSAPQIPAPIQEAPQEISQAAIVTPTPIPTPTPTTTPIKSTNNKDTAPKIIAPSPTPKIYPIIPQGDISKYDNELQWRFRNVYSRFLNTPDLQHKTPEEQYGILNNILEEDRVQYQLELQKDIDRLKREEQERIAKLEAELETEKQILEQLKQENARSLQEALASLITERNQKLEELKQQIDFQQKRYDTACEGVTMSFCAGQRAYIASILNPLIDQYNLLLYNEYSGKIYSSIQSSYFIFEADRFGRGGVLYEPFGSTRYTFDCDQWGSCRIY